jgi:hypothetical protein
MSINLNTGSNAGNVPFGANDDPRAPWNNPDPEYYIYKLSEVDVDHGGGIIVTIKDQNSDYREDHHIDPEDILDMLDYT